jgi:hypothetical protein
LQRGKKEKQKREKKERERGTEEQFVIVYKRVGGF